MSLEDFQLLDEESFDNSIVKRDYLRVYHQQDANLKDSDQHVEFIFGENNNYHQIGFAYLEQNIRVQNHAAAFDDNSRIKLTINGLAYVFHEAVWLLLRNHILNIINLQVKHLPSCEF